MTRRYAIRMMLAAFALPVAAAGTARAEDCVTGVRILAPWTSAIRGNAGQWPAAARAAGFPVDRTLVNGAVLAYGGGYGSGISTLGHVAYVVDARVVNGRITIRDSSDPYPGVPGQYPASPGWARQVRTVLLPPASNPNWSVIHPKR